MAKPIDGGRIAQRDTSMDFVVCPGCKASGFMIAKAGTGSYRCRVSGTSVNKPIQCGLNECGRSMIAEAAVQLAEEDLERINMKKLIESVDGIIEELKKVKKDYAPLLAVSIITRLTKQLDEDLTTRLGVLRCAIDLLTESSTTTYSSTERTVPKQYRIQQQITHLPSVR